MHLCAGGEANEGGEQESSTFTMLNAFWFMIASLLQQGTDILPRYESQVHLVIEVYHNFLYTHFDEHGTITMGQ